MGWLLITDDDDLDDPLDVVLPQPFEHHYEMGQAELAGYLLAAMRDRLPPKC